MKKREIIALTIILLLPLVIAATQEEKQQYQECNSNCSEIKKVSQEICKSEFVQCKENCQDNKCIPDCAKNKTTCLKQTSSDFRLCKAQCKEIIATKCIYNETLYSVGETFESSCNICECKTSGKFSCKKEAFCNKNPEVPQELCEESGGFYQALCNGPYFHMSCTQDKYCQCGGTYNYTCPQNHTCLTDFVPPKLGHYVPGYRNLNGQPLGDIGICVF
jgi:hypothetical protein